MTPQQQNDFIASLAPGAQAAQKKWGVFASVSIAQSIFESTWGTSGLFKKSNNLFGIKKTPDWTGPVVEMETGEFSPSGVHYMIDAPFRAYPSPAASIDDHGAFLANNGKPVRYLAALNAADALSQAMAIGAAGYSSQPIPKYGEMLCAEIKARNLTQYDLQKN